MATEDKITSLFKSALKDYQKELTLSEISLLKQVTIKSKFYKFSPYNFNIYYASLIISGFLITLTLAGHYLYTINSQPLNRTLISETIKVEKIKNTPRSNSSLNYIQEDTKQAPNNIQSSKNKLPKYSIESDLKNHTQHDSTTNTKLIVPNSDSISIINPVKKERKKIVITKRDTIFQLDTLYEKDILKKRK